MISLGIFILSRCPSVDSYLLLTLAHKNKQQTEQKTKGPAELDLYLLISANNVRRAK